MEHKFDGGSLQGDNSPIGEKYKKMGKHLQSVQAIPQTLKPAYVYNVGVEGNSSIYNCRPNCMLILNLSTNGSYCVSHLE